MLTIATIISLTFQRMDYFYDKNCSHKKFSSCNSNANLKSFPLVFVLEFSIPEKNYNLLKLGSPLYVRLRYLQTSLLNK